jgi:hypothetical protein
MPLPFDATMKELVQSYPHDWLAQFGMPSSGPVTVLNVDFSTITAATDLILAVGDPFEVLLDLNFQSSRDEDLSRRILVYNALLHRRHRVPVHSAVLLLRPAADDAELTGVVRYEGRPGHGGLAFTFEVVRIWEKPVESILTGGLGTLALAPLAQVPPGIKLEAALPGVLRQMEERLAREAPAEDAAKLLTAAFILTGMRLPRAAAVKLFEGVRSMKESTTYQYILDEGRAEGQAVGARKILLRQGRQRFGPASAEIERALDAITDLEHLERLADRLWVASNWEDLLQTP